VQAKARDRLAARVAKVIARLTRCCVTPRSEFPTVRFQVARLLIELGVGRLLSALKPALMSIGTRGLRISARRVSVPAISSDDRSAQSKSVRELLMRQRVRRIVVAVPPRSSSLLAITCDLSDERG
jgi:hypothetical protein